MSTRSKSIKINNFKVMIKYNDNFNFLILEEKVITSLNKVKNFLGDIEVNLTDFKIDLVYSRKQYDKKVKRKTKRWEIANTSNNSFIIFHPDFIESETDHKKEEFDCILTHEIAHVITNSINSIFLNWISEGIAQYIADQKPSTKYVKQSNVNHFIKNNFYKNSNYQDFISHEGYEVSYWLIKYILEKYGKKNISSLINTKNNSNSKNQLEEIFSKPIKDIEREVLKLALRIS